ncbi:NADH-quinone oxidoreductase subunit N [bacterium]|nr:NADH-quinone oxidoreductase subunit N [bacterium]
MTPIDIDSYKAVLMAGLPVWILCGGGVLALLLDAIFNRKGSLVVYLTGIATMVATLAVCFNQWDQTAALPQTALKLDLLTRFFIVLVLVVGLLSLCQVYAYLKTHTSSTSTAKGPLGASMVTLILFSIAGQVFLFSADHLITSFIGLEIMSLAVYVLVGSKKDDPRSNEAAMKYFVLGSVASAFILYGIALLYGSFGFLTFSQLSGVGASTEFLPRIGLVFVLAGVLFKLGIAPFHFWVPDVYEGAPVPVTGFMSTAVKAASIAFFIRIITNLHFIPDVMVSKILFVCVILTIAVGNLGALMQENLKRMLAYSSIAHAGYMLLGLYSGFKDGQFDPQASTAVLFYLIGYSVMSLGAFGVLSVMVDHQKEACQFSDLNGLGYSRPVLAACFSLFMLSLLGIPPTVGFVGKYFVFSYAVAHGQIPLAIFGVIMSIVSAYYYLRPMVAMYFKGKSDRLVITSIPLPLMFAVVFCVVAILILGINPKDYIDIALMAVNPAQ